MRAGRRARRCATPAWSAPTSSLRLSAWWRLVSLGLGGLVKRPHTRSSLSRGGGGWDPLGARDQEARSRPGVSPDAARRKEASICAGDKATRRTATLPCRTAATACVIAQGSIPPCGSKVTSPGCPSPARPRRSDVRFSSCCGRGNRRTPEASWQGSGHPWMMLGSSIGGMTTLGVS